MRHTVAVDRGDHWDVYADLTDSKVIGRMTDEQFKMHFKSDAFKPDRDSATGPLVAAITPKGVGKWKKDWSGPHVTQEALDIESAKKARSATLESARAKRRAGAPLTPQERDDVIDALLGL